jgi:hypothetical protein
MGSLEIGNVVSWWFSHHSHEGNAAHVGDKRIILRHVTDQRADLVQFTPNVVAQHFCGARRERTEPQQRMDEGGLACAVWAKQSNRSARKSDAQLLQDLTFPKAHAQPRQFNDRLHELVPRGV